MPTSVSALPRAPFADQDAAPRPSQGRADGETCGHHCPNHPGWIPCQRPPGHDREDGHRDSAETCAQHIWDDHGGG